MEEWLLNCGVFSSTIHTITQEGFTTEEDLLLLDDWSYSKLNLPLQQMLLLRKIIESSKRPSNSSVHGSSLDSQGKSSIRRGKMYRNSSEFGTDSQFLYPETPENRGDDYFNFEDSSYWPRDYQDDIASTVDLLSDSEIQNHDDIPSVVIDDSRMNEKEPQAKYFTLPANTSQSQYGMGSATDFENKKLKYGSLDKSHAVNFELDDEDYKSRQPPLNYLQHQYKHLFDKRNMTYSDVSDSEFSTPRNIFNKQNSNSLGPPIGALSSRRSSANDIFDMPVDFQNLSEKELDDRRKKFREKYKGSKLTDAAETPAYLQSTDSLRKEKRIRKLREMMETSSRSSYSTSRSVKENESNSPSSIHPKLSPLSLNQSEHTRSSFGDSLSSPRLPGSNKKSRSFSERRRMMSSAESVRSTSSRYSNASGYFTNCEHDHVIEILDKIRGRVDSNQPIPALIIDLNEVDCMYVEEGCLYLTPKDHSDDSPFTPGNHGTKGLESLFMGMAGASGGSHHPIDPHYDGHSASKHSGIQSPRPLSARGGTTRSRHDSKPNATHISSRI